MIISIEYQEKDIQNKVTKEISNDSDIHEAMEAFCGLLVAYGYHPESVEDAILSKAEEYGEEKIDEKTT